MALTACLPTKTSNNGKQVKWSHFYQGNVCLASTECTKTWHCPWGKACYMNSTDTDDDVMTLMMMTMMMILR